ncbi:hypothetical protein IU469_30950 [Nocardia puris]|uniref:hypothetical protein n=1 Tax=Nocardia puris TaxID=208602 RepID=UPI00189506D3|nr:hypothetical protein [Nocardia puris]MBF6370093.1 hypothetical protein [Nocardia puris]
MLTVPDLIEWLTTLAPTSLVAIDDGGMVLEEISPGGHATGAYLEVGGFVPDPAEAPVGGLTASGHAAHPGLPVISVSDLLGMLGGTLTHIELADVRVLIPRSSISDSLGDVLDAAIGERRHQLTALLCEPADPSRFAGCLGTGTLARVPAEHLDAVFAEFEIATGLPLIRVSGNDGVARVCVELPTGRLLDLGEDLLAWLQGDEPALPPINAWIGEAALDLDPDELIPVGARDYVLATTSEPVA